MKTTFIVSVASMALSLSWAIAASAEPLAESASAEAADAASAPRSSVLNEARLRFREASAHAADGDWGQALELYTAAYALYPHATTLYNVGYCHGQLGRLTQALDLTSQALHEGSFAADRQLGPDRRATALAYQEELIQRLASVVIDTTAGAIDVRIDGVPVKALALGGGSYVPTTESVESIPKLANGARIVLLPGPHELRLSADGEHEVRSISLVEGQRLEVAWSPHPNPQTTPPASVPPATPPAAPLAEGTESPRGGSNTTYRRAMVGSFVVGGAGFAVALGAGIVAASTHGQLDSRCTDGLCPADESDRVDRYTWAARLTNAGLLVGVAGTVAGIGFALFEDTATERAVSVVVQPRSVGVRGSF